MIHQPVAGQKLGAWGGRWLPKREKRAKTVKGGTSDDGRANWLESLKKGFSIVEKVLMPCELIPVLICMNIQSCLARLIKIIKKCLKLL